jgi:hypothetical protein
MCLTRSLHNVARLCVCVCVCVFVCVCVCVRACVRACVFVNLWAGGFLGGADHYTHRQGSGAEDIRGGRVGGACNGYDVRRCSVETLTCDTDWSADGNYSTTLWTSEIESIIASHNRKE